MSRSVLTNATFYVGEDLTPQTGALVVEDGSIRELGES